jgi:integrase
MVSATTAPLVAAAGARPRLAIPASQPFARSIGVASALQSRLVEGLRTRRSHDRKQRAKPVTSAGALARLPFTIDPDVLRHASGFKLANDGHDTRSLQHYLGHKNIAHTVRYTELAPDRFKGSGGTESIGLGGHAKPTKTGSNRLTPAAQRLKRAPP